IHLSRFGQSCLMSTKSHALSARSRLWASRSLHWSCSFRTWIWTKHQDSVQSGEWITS
ncbi:hypothetical protein HDU81_000411, partial [Chytriomyces hyalinus]